MRIETTTWKRLGWMVAIWIASVMALGSVSLLLKWWLTG
ncbi:DUF2474 family protein [Microbulbifer celer]|uniref:DUF2474 family protein n=1 Tax=Microbulbifer celer TaxID=435905 RepID=A0ABW3U7C9_9GAMM|nr:DUF2474 family protein [Microbulbifer celer]UFN57040.1 DUF2474 domain-containing protein [Microbulbifer celer]